MKNEQLLSGTIQVHDNYTNSLPNYSCKSTALFNNMCSSPEMVSADEVGDSIEIVYKQESMLYRTGGLPPYNDTRVYKIIYSCVDGKWNKSEPIYGKIIPQQTEYYQF